MAGSFVVRTRTNKSSSSLRMTLPRASRHMDKMPISVTPISRALAVRIRPWALGWTCRDRPSPCSRRF